EDLADAETAADAVVDLHGVLERRGRDEAVLERDPAVERLDAAGVVDLLRLEDGVDLVGREDPEAAHDVADRRVAPLLARLELGVERAVEVAASAEEEANGDLAEELVRVHARLPAGVSKYRNRSPNAVPVFRPKTHGNRGAPAACLGDGPGHAAV